MKKQKSCDNSINLMMEDSEIRKKLSFLYNIEFDDIDDDLLINNRKKKYDKFIKPLPEPLVDIFLLELNHKGILSDNDIKNLVNKSLEKIEE
jgi:hypothetical protein